MKISIFGTGYVGLVTGTCLSEIGHEVVCIDIDESKIKNLKNGIIPIYEPGLEELVKRNHNLGRLRFTTNAKEGVDFGTVIFSAVGTPPDKNHKADLKFVKKIAETIGNNMNEYKVLVNKSTVPVGTGDICINIIQKELEKRNQKIDFDIVSNPEFLKEGTAVKDFMLPDRIVCGVASDKAKELMQKIYNPLIRANSPIMFTDIRSAEVIKYAANSFLATKISFINEMANFAEKVGANISDISRGIGMDKRIGPKFLHAGLGYGGSCFPKDVQALIQTGKEHDYNFQIIQATESVNQKQKLKVLEKLKKHINDLQGKTITIRGLSFKPKTDDIREAPSLLIINKLLEECVSQIKCFDPVAMKETQKLYPNNDKIVFCSTNYDAIKDSDALLLITERDEFRAVDFEQIKDLMNGNIIIDGRNIRNKKEIEELELVYEGIGG